MAANNQLVIARKTKDDEFYTPYNMISQEMCNYSQLLKNKHIVCPCEWEETLYRWKKNNDENYKKWINGPSNKYLTNEKQCNFVKYLENKKDEWKIATIDFCGYCELMSNEQKILNTDLFKSINDNQQNKGIIKFEDSLPMFKQKYKKDIVVITNPPFSLFKEFVDLLVELEIDFIILGPFNATNYKNVFQHLLNGKINRGYVWDKSGIFNRLDGTQKTVGISWYTSFSGQEWQKSYHMCNYSLKEIAEKFKKKCEIVVSKKGEKILDIRRCIYIPNNYKGKMEVPISFFDVWNKEQFDIIGNNSHPNFYPEYDHMKLPSTKKSPFFSLIIKYTDKWIETNNNIKWLDNNDLCILEQ